MQIRGVMATVRVQNIDRALRFYRDTLGFTVEQEEEEWVMFAEGVALQVAPEALPDISFNVNAVLVTLLVDDVQTIYAELVKKGVPFFLPPTENGGALYATLRDTENNLLQLLQLA